MVYYVLFWYDQFWSKIEDILNDLKIKLLIWLLISYIVIKYFHNCLIHFKKCSSPVVVAIFHLKHPNFFKFLHFSGYFVKQSSLVYTRYNTIESWRIERDFQKQTRRSATWMLISQKWNINFRITVTWETSIRLIL